MYSCPTTRRPTWRSTPCTSAMSACEETCVATRTLQRVVSSELGVRPQFRGLAGFKFVTEAMAPPGGDQSGPESIHATSAWAPPVTLPRLLPWTSARLIVAGRTATRRSRTALPGRLDTCAQWAPEQELQVVTLAGRQRPPLAWPQRAERDRSESHADQAIDLEPERLAQAPHLAVSALADRDLELRRSVPERTSVHGDRMQDAILELDTATSLRGSDAGITANSGDVRALDLAARMGEHVRSLAVRREQQEPFGQVVEAAHIR